MKGFLIAVVTLFARLVAPFIVPVALVFRQRFEFTVKVDSERYFGCETRLPKWAAWLDTPDQCYPGDLTILTMRAIRNKYGDFITAWVWLSFRNVFFGFAWQFGKEVQNYMVHLSPAERLIAGVNERIYSFLGLEIITGWAIYRDWYGVKSTTGFWAVPRFSIRLAKDHD